MRATDLLNAFTGNDNGELAPLFRFSEDKRIVSVDIHALGMDNTTARYSGQEHAWYEVNNILRIRTADGFEGVSGVDTYYADGFSDAHLLELQSVAADVASLELLDPALVTARLETKHPNLSNEALASIDIALWDLAAKRGRRPLYDLLGASRDSLPAYASLPFYETLPEYIEAVREYAGLGFTRFKFHVWGSLEEDLKLIRLVQETFTDSQYRFMIDNESMYDYDDALVLGKAMDEGLFVWFEAPVDDRKLSEYATLRQELSNTIIPAGYTVHSEAFIREGIEVGAWDMGRFDATVVGGFSRALKRLIIANDADVIIDIQSWGHTLAQAANLHLMLANSRTPYFEAPMPKNVFEFGMINANLIDAGLAVAPEGAGLGSIVDWEGLISADYHVTVTLELSDRQ